ncbi:MAG: LicD family protein [Atopobiaceae bacterium]|nr:LicD family protein [Atopobiaceae bacterium]
MTSMLREHQLVMLEMLRVLDRICSKYGISYQLFAGTALGAVRHGGFIPWDDDLDVVMLRDEYNRFLKVAPEEVGEPYYVQAEFSDHWPCAFSKLRKNGTACIERYIPKDSQTHQGVYIDIFPCDNLSSNGLMRGLQFVASKLLIAQALDKRGYITNNYLKKIAMIGARYLPRGFLYHIVIDSRDSSSCLVHTFLGASRSYRKAIYPRQWFENSVDISFEGSLYPVSLNYHELLTKLYGSYMKMPSKECVAIKTHAELVDLEHSYEHYVGIQNEMTFDVLTRSIR